MDIALRGTNRASSTSTTGTGLHHAVSLGNIEVSTKTTYSSHMDRSYDSEDEHTGRRRLRHTLSTELHPHTSVYSRGDIREQYCLTDRQLHSIEQRPRRERFFGCLSRRGQTQSGSFLGGCVGRRVPSDENLAAYAPFEKYPRYQNSYTDTHELESSYFRRQPASILSTGKSGEADLGGRYTWIGQQQVTNNNPDYQSDHSSYHCPTYATMPTTHHQHHHQQQGGNVRTKHVSFARSHTLTSFDNVNAGFRSSGRLKTARSQERLIGGKKPIIATGSMYETLQPPLQAQQQPQQMQPQQSSTLPKTWLPPPVQLQPCQHHHAPIHLHQPIPDNMVGLIIPQPLPLALPLPSPEVLIVEKKFRNAMKTQATQTDAAARRQGQIGYNTQVLALSPRPPHRIKVVSQGAQTNGLQNGKKLTKSLSEIPNGKDGTSSHHYQQGSIYPHEMIYRTQSQDVTPLQTLSDAQNNIMYYKPPPPLLDAHSYGLGMEHLSRTRPSPSEQSVEYVNVNAAAVALNESFDYESNSLPRRACTSHTDFYSNSLPRRHITESSELMTDSVPLDFSQSHLLPPPSEYCKNDDEDVEEYYDEEEDHPHETESYSSEVCMEQAAQHRRMSMLPQMIDSPFRRDDLRRQSMPVYGQTEKLIDGFGPRSSFRRRDKVSCFPDEPPTVPEVRDEQEIFIDFKPHISPKPSPKLQLKHRKQHKAEIAMKKMQQQRMAQAAALTLPKPKSQPVEVEVRKVELEPSDEEEDEDEVSEPEEEDDGEEIDEDEQKLETDLQEDEEPLYENITPCGCRVVPQPDVENIQDKRSQFRKRSVSLDDDYEAKASETPTPTGLRLPSTPASPCRDELLANVSTYPSSDSLANDNTRDHSDGIWNESQVTVLTAEQRDISDGSYSSNLLLTPSSKRKNLLLQHQQRSSVDTDALDFEEQSPTYGLQTLPKIIKTPTPTTSRPTSTQPMMPPPAIAVTPSTNQILDSCISSPLPKRSMVPRGSVPDARQLMFTSGAAKQRHSDASFLPMGATDYARSADISECSTNTDEYATCTDTSKRTPVSTQSSQLEKTHAGSSFESASSLYSMREDLLQHDEKERDKQAPLVKAQLKSPIGSVAELTRKSPSHSISSTTSSGSCPVSGAAIKSPAKESLPQTVASSGTSQMKVSSAECIPPGVKPKPDSISEDERSEVRYSSSGYYESPHEEDDEEQGTRSKARRLRQEDERKRRKTSMKLDIEKENMRALTSPIKKPTGSSKITSPEQSISGTMDNGSSPSKMKRFRPKIRRQLRKSSREDVLAAAAVRRSRATPTIFGLSSGSGDTELLLDASMSTGAVAGTTTTAVTSVSAPSSASKLPTSESSVTTQPEAVVAPMPAKKPHSCATPTSLLSPKLPTTSGTQSKSTSDTFQLKAKSIESLRSVSPGSDSVFYSEADGNAASGEQSHCHHCGKEMEGKQQSNTISELAGDSVESIPYIEQDIVKPPSDFADSPVTTKTTQRLYKKMDKRFRSEERYHGERGRHYKTRQENIRAKSEERGRIPSLPNTPVLRPAGSSPCVLPDTEQSQHIIYKGHYDAGRYTRLTDDDLWTQLDHQCFDRSRERRASTESEKGFHAKYQVILHRLVQRRCTLEMYHRQKHNSFLWAKCKEISAKSFRNIFVLFTQYSGQMIELIASNSTPDSIRRKLEEVLKLMLLVWARESYVITKLSNGAHGVDKTVVVKSDSGEFGFRIHGSKPVVVAAIEPETPAESSGLEVGDIIISVNGVQVLDKHHTEVVKIAHDGCEKLELQVARTIGVLMHEQLEPPSQPIFSGYLWRQSGQAKGAPNTKKWVRRWFSLRPDNCLYYYKTEDDSQPVGAMIMAKHTVDLCPVDVGKPFAFKVDAGEGIPMYVAADSDEMANRWLQLLRQAASQDNQWLDKSARCLYQSPSNIQRPDCFGYLLKLGSRWCGWSKRYCVLKDACLYFYQDANSKSAFGMACLHGYKVASMSANASGKKNSFEIVPPETKLRHYFFCTESEMDKKRWISALEYSIDRWIKSG
ncbi:uncharacterized protein LOC6730915 isoform X7 [Drosophila simulans]|uniref:Uncharacterized protein, isoform I n=1 Tax=Drosophila simulans TaxID=7240 RepID=A0A0J9QVA0_DROSI|nr:uncharacterized protein LOC6730915 isoform X7 [Drosophila simulans]KMY87977.1 uncharacterized protein Dsimw501_GD23253, isoform I [Drosophila simulans]